MLAKVQSPRFILLRRFSKSRTHSITSTTGGVSTNFFNFMSEDASIFIQDIICLKTENISIGKMSMSMKLKPQLSGHVNGSIHGGILATIIDHVGGFCAWTVFDRPGLLLSTVDLRIDYLELLSLDEEGVYMTY
jgi:acyl-coenzyme A thioesterase PaaI-like protein